MNIEQIRKRLERAKARVWTDPFYVGTSVYIADVGELLDQLALYEDLGTVEELAELVKAKQDNRLAVLPCKVGDDIFTLSWSIKNQKLEVCAGKVKNARYGSADSSVMVSDGERYHVWGKTIFLTREEAEAALSKEGVPNV